MLETNDKKDDQFKNQSPLLKQFLYCHLEKKKEEKIN